MLDHRLSLAASLYDPCFMGCDIGTDHGLLPCYLLRSRICERMILADISPKALAHARAQVQRQHLESRAVLSLSDGLDALDSVPSGTCSCVSLMGVGGDCASRILKNGTERLHQATLVLSVHTDQHLVRACLSEIGYQITDEKLCFDRGRYYIFWRAVPGEMHLSQEEMLYGTQLLFQPSPLLKNYLSFRLTVNTRKLNGLLSASECETDDMLEAHNAVAFYSEQLKRLF